MTDPEIGAQHVAPPTPEERVAAQAAADARATRLLVRIGVVAVGALLVWILVVVASFVR